MVSDNATEFTIEVPDTFDFETNVGYLARSPHECMHSIEGNVVSKRIPAGKSAPLVSIEGRGNEPLRVRLREQEARANEEQVQAIIRFVKEWFDLDSDLSSFYSIARGDVLLAPLAEAYRGLRMIGIPDLYEAVCWGILGQQINLAFAYTLKRRFVETFGEAISYGGRLHWTFPKPADIANLAPEALTSLQLTGRKAEYLIGVAKLIDSGELNKEQLLRAANPKEAERRLVSIRGIGPWTANYVLMRCLRLPSAFPIDDVGLHNAIKLRLGLPEKPTISHIRELSAGWAGWEAYATFYLWRALETHQASKSGK